MLFSGGNPYKPSFVIVAGWGVDHGRSNISPFCLPWWCGALPTLPRVANFTRTSPTQPSGHIPNSPGRPWALLFFLQNAALGKRGILKIAPTCPRRSMNIGIIFIRLSNIDQVYQWFQPIGKNGQNWIISPMCRVENHPKSKHNL